MICHESSCATSHGEPVAQGVDALASKGKNRFGFLLELLENDSAVNLAAGMETPEFDSWRWVDTHHAIDNIVDFKRAVYEKALSELGEFLPTDLVPRK